MSIKIIERSREFSRVEEYLMTLSPSITSIKDLEDDQAINYNGHIIFEDVKQDGSVEEILSIITTDNQVFSCQSKTFKRSLFDIVSLFDGEKISVIPLKKISGVTKSGKNYVNCILDVTKL